MIFTFTNSSLHLLLFAAFLAFPLQPAFAQLDMPGHTMETRDETPPDQLPAPRRIKAMNTLPQDEATELGLPSAMAETYWPHQNAIGQHMDGNLTVVGVVGNRQHRSLSEKPLPEFYESL